MDKFINNARIRRKENLKRKRKQRNIKILFFVIICAIIVLIFNHNKIFTKKENVSNNTSAQNTQQIEKEEKKTIKITAVGDIMCHNTQFKDAYDSSTKKYDFSYVFEEIEPYFQDADLVIGNLETTFAGKDANGYSGYPNFNTPEAMATNLKELGFDVLTTSNNHSLDKGYKGLVSTLDELDEAGISHTGTARSTEEQNSVLVKEVNGIKIGFLSYTYGTNGIPVPKGKEYCVNLIDKDAIAKEIDRIKLMDVDLICASMHWGVEYKLKQNSEQEDLANFLFDNGVDIILGSHPHVLEPMEKKQHTMPDGSTKDVFVIYSLGNFISGQTAANTDTSIILNIQISKENGKITIDSVDYIPICMINKYSSTKKYKVLATNDAIEAYKNKSNSNITAAIYSKLEKSLSTANKVLGE